MNQNQNMELAVLLLFTKIQHKSNPKNLRSQQIVRFSKQKCWQSKKRGIHTRSLWSHWCYRSAVRIIKDSQWSISAFGNPRSKKQLVNQTKSIISSPIPISLEWVKAHHEDVLTISPTKLFGFRNRKNKLEIFLIIMKGKRIDFIRMITFLIWKTWQF